jgi:hypothetical protein
VENCFHEDGVDAGAVTSTCNKETSDDDGGSGGDVDRDDDSCGDREEGCPSGGEEDLEDSEDAES